jgi:hypothetical protein
MRQERRTLVQSVKLPAAEPASAPGGENECVDGVREAVPIDLASAGGPK